MDKYYTTAIDIDVETGEIISLTIAKRKYLEKIYTITTYKKNGHITERKIERHWRKPKQTRLF